MEANEAAARGEEAIAEMVGQTEAPLVVKAEGGVWVGVETGADDHGSTRRRSNPS